MHITKVSSIKVSEHFYANESEKKQLSRTKQINNKMRITAMIFK